MGTLKSGLQKAYEKFAMIRLHPDRLGVMLARGADGNHHVVLIIKNEDGDGGRPLADLMHGLSIVALEPIHNATLDTEFQDNFECEDRRTIAEFDAPRIQTEFSEGIQPRHL